tara:strand:+ start:296 stop:451 length:156 start_codon:yes stop_codon:yes gene_type:complete
MYFIIETDGEHVGIVGFLEQPMTFATYGDAIEWAYIQGLKYPDIYYAIYEM